MSPLKATPPVGNRPDAGNLEDFIGGAASAPRQPKTPGAVPWKAPGVAGAATQVNTRLPGRVALKLKLLCALTDLQRQDLIAESLEPLLDAKLRELGYSDEDLKP
jgi:hypothetical protein